MATPIEIAREFFPEFDDVQLDHILWERTGMPCFWPNRSLSVGQNIRNQLAEFKEALKLGVSLCDFCNKPAEEGDYTCESCGKALDAARTQPEGK